MYEIAKRPILFKIFCIILLDLVVYLTELSLNVNVFSITLLVFCLKPFNCLAAALDGIIDWAENHFIALPINTWSHSFEI